MTTASISVALIVKDEARSLGRCLRSLRAAVDEIVVVDTGSSDATREIAAGFTDRLFDFTWCHDFAAARQYAFDQATGDWVIWVDADDVVVGAERLRELLDQTEEDVAGYYMPYVVARDTWGNVECTYWRERCVRHNGTFRWAGRVHETLLAHKPARLERSDVIVVEHRPETRHRARKLRRNIDMLEAELVASGDRPTPRLLFYLGREYASAGDLEPALSHYLRYLQVAIWDEERYRAQIAVASIYRQLGQYEHAIDADLAALKVCPHWPDAYFGLACTYYFQEAWHRAIHWTDMGRAMPQPDTIHIIDPMDYRFHWIIYYTIALYRVGEIREALRWTRTALEIRPDDPWHQKNLQLFARQLPDEGCRKEAHR